MTLPATWSDSSVITTTMRATSRNCNTQTGSAKSVVVVSTPEPRASDGTTIANTSNTTSRLSVTSILSSANNQQTTSISRHKTYEPFVTTTVTMNRSIVVSTQASTALRNNMCAGMTSSVQTTSTPMTVTRTPNTHSRQNVTATGSGNVQLSQLSRPSQVATSSNDKIAPTASGKVVVQPIYVSQPQTIMVPSGGNVRTVAPLAQASPSGPTSFERSQFNQVQQLRSHSVQDNISQLPYSIDALTGNQASHTRQQNTGTGQLLNFSAESLIGRQQPSNDIVMINSPVNQPVIQNTFTLTHRNAPGNPSVTSGTAPPQSFSNFSALSLVGRNATFSGSATSTTQTLTRSTNAVPETGSIPQPSNQMFTDFSTESLIGSSEFTSDFAIDNLISRSDSSVHMATVNPNLIQSFGKGNDPMISSVSGDPSSHFSHSFEPPNLNMGMFSSHLFPTYW